MSVLKDSYTTSTSSTNCYGTQWLAQTFTAGSSYTISEVSIKAFRFGSPGTVTISIRATSGDSPTGADLCSGTINGDGFTTSSTGRWYTVDLGAGTFLSSGTVYAIVCRATSGDSDNFMRWRLDGNAGYDSGRMLTSSNSGSSWTGQSYDFTFQTYKDVVNYNVNISCGLGLSPSVSASRGKTVSSSTSLSLSPSATAVRGRNVSIETGLSLCVDGLNKYLITIPSNITKDVVDFPFVITENNIPSSFWDEAETDNLILRDVTGGLLYGELVTLDTVNKKLELYVKIPYAFEGISRSFYLYCGDGDSLVGLTGTANAQNVWDSNFVGIYHMNDNAAGDGILDSTSNANHATKWAGDAAPTEVNGLIGKAQSFDGTNDRILLPLISGVSNSWNIDILYDRTGISQSGSTGYTILFGRTNSRRILISDYSGNALSQMGTTHFSDGGILTVNNHDWQLLTYNHDGTNASYYIDGVFNTSQELTQTLDVGLSTWSIGSYGADAYWFNGLIPEFRISNTARDGGWIGFTSSNLKENSTSYSVTETSQTSPSRQVNYSRDSLTNLSLASIVTRTVNYAVRHIVTSLSLNPIVTRTVGYTRTISTSLSLTSIVSAIKRGWVKVKLKLFKRSVNMYMNNRNVKVKLHKRDVNLKIRRK